MPTSGYKNKEIARLCWLLGFIGLCGLHRIYVGKYASGLFYLCTLGVFGLGQLSDIGSIGDMCEEANMRDLPRWEETRYRRHVSHGRGLARVSPIIFQMNTYHEAKPVVRVRCGYCGLVSDDHVRKCAKCGADLAA